MIKLGQFLKEKRKEKGYSLRDLEKRAGVTHPHIQYYVEEGIRKPTFEVVMKLLEALNVEASEFVETATKGEFALRVEGDSMEPEFHEGDIIVVNPHRKQEHNDYVVVCNADYEATLKQLKKYGEVRVLHPLNPKYDDIELTKDGGHKLIGVVVEKKRRY